jgi:hypothetical protein
MLEVSIILCRRKAKNLHGRIRPAGSRKKCEDAKHKDAREERNLTVSQCSYDGTRYLPSSSPPYQAAESWDAQRLACYSNDGGVVLTVESHQPYETVKYLGCSVVSMLSK